MEHGKPLYDVQGEVDFSEFGLEKLLQAKGSLKGLYAAFGPAEPLQSLLSGKSWYCFWID